MKGKEIEIFAHMGGNFEDWLTVMEDGSLKYVTDDSNAWRGTLQTKRLTAEEAIKRWPNHAEAIHAAVNELTGAA